MSIADRTKFLYKGLKERPKYLYNKEEIEKFEEYVKEHFGEYTKVYHELYSPDIHLDILVIPPSEESNYYKLITRGMGAYKMNVPDIIKDYGIDRAELIMYLSPDWNLNFNKEENGWIIRELKRVARTPIIEDSWVGYGHTFAESVDMKESLSKTSNFTSTILVPPIDKDWMPLNLNLSNQKIINFYQVVPLYKEKFKYKEEYGVKKFLELVDNYKKFLIVDVNRKNICKERELVQEEDIDLEK